MDLDGLPYAVVPMRLADVPTVSQVERVVFSLPWSATAFDYELRRNRASEYLVLRYLPLVERARVGQMLVRGVGQLLKRPKTDRSILGYGGFWIVPREAHICTLAVRPEWRERGLGEMLLLTLIERALERGAKVVTLEVRATNHTAQNLYKKYRFEQIGMHKRYYSDNGEDALVMAIPSIVSPDYQDYFGELRELLRRRLVRETQDV